MAPATTGKSFRTNDNQTYSIRYDLPTVRNVRDAIEIDLLSGDGLRKCCGSPVDFALVLYETVRDQVEAAGIDRDDFLISLEGCDAMAVDRWLEALSDFFRRVGRDALARLAESLVRLDREINAEANTLDAETADRICSRELAAAKRRRQKTLAQMLGENGSPSTPG